MKTVTIFLRGILFLSLLSAGIPSTGNAMGMLHHHKKDQSPSIQSPLTLSEKSNDISRYALFADDQGTSILSEKNEGAPLVTPEPLGSYLFLFGALASLLAVFKKGYLSSRKYDRKNYLLMTALWSDQPARV
jgi:hypothetical protein